MKFLSLLAVACISTCMAMAAASEQNASGTPVSPAFSATESTAGIASAMRQHLFDPAQTHSPAYLRTMARVERLASENPSRKAFADGFNEAWRDGPFSHVRLGVAQGTEAQIADHFDHMRVGGRGASLAWQGDIAILTVNTMMGLDTIEQIDAAYVDIAGRGAKAVIVDLRANEGGAFAVRPLVAHALVEPLDAGVFLGARWFARGKPAPTKAAVAAMPAWQGWSLKAFWNDVEQQGVLRIRFEPVAPTYAGPMFVLTSHRTASAAEMAADALQASGRAVLVGETTAGQMLSQKMYDIPGGLQLSLPIADYRSHHRGRIEGKGVQPDLAVPADQAMAKALALATQP